VDLKAPQDDASHGEQRPQQGQHPRDAACLARARPLRVGPDRCRPSPVRCS
jgi:hypothetical protein